MRVAGRRLLRSRRRSDRLIGTRFPEQISGWLKIQFPDDASVRVSHETIYRSLFIQAAGVLKKELTDHLRSTPSVRRSRHASPNRQSRQQIVDAISIAKSLRKWKIERFPDIGKAIC